MQLRPCGECGRHVVVTESACPFCGATIERAVPKRALIGKVTRAAVFASASASAACWTHSPATSTTTSEGSGAVSNHGGGSAAKDDVSIPAPLPGMASIGGICRDSATGQPLADVYVQLFPGVGADRRDTKCDARGHYALDNVPPGDWNIEFRGPRDPGRMAPPAQFVTLKAGETRRIDGNVDNRDWSNMPMPYGAPPARRRVV